MFKIADGSDTTVMVNERRWYFGEEGSHESTDLVTPPLSKIAGDLIDSGHISHHTYFDAVGDVFSYLATSEFCVDTLSSLVNKPRAVKVNLAEEMVGEGFTYRFRIPEHEEFSFEIRQSDTTTLTPVEDGEVFDKDSRCWFVAQPKHNYLTPIIQSTMDKLSLLAVKRDIRMKHYPMDDSKVIEISYLDGHGTTTLLWGYSLSMMCLALTK